MTTQPQDLAILSRVASQLENLIRRQKELRLQQMSEAMRALSWESAGFRDGKIDIALRGNCAIKRVYANSGRERG